MGKKLLQFFVYSNLFIAGCAVLMVYQTSWLISNDRPDFNLTGFVLFSTLCSYSFHWYLTSDTVIPSERVEWLKKYRYVHTILFFIGLAGAAYCFYQLLPYWHWLLIGAFATFLYSAPKIPHPWFRLLRKVAIGKTIFLAFVWMYVTCILPAVIVDVPIKSIMLFAISRFFLIYAICILFDYRDREDDKAAGVKSLITYLSERSITILFYSSILVFVATTLWMMFHDGIPLDFIIVLLIPGIITAALYKYARKNFNDMFYYFVLDGLMALSAILIPIWKLFQGDSNGGI